LSEITRLPSGLTIVTQTRQEVETVALGVFVNAGTRDELLDEHGLAHFLEHMAFKGTARRSAFETVAHIEALGGDINAETSPEATSYTVRMLAEDWHTGLDVLLDLVSAPRFDPADIALEKDVVCQEIAGAMDMPDDRVVDGIGMAAFPDHPLGRTILGTEQTVRSLNAAKLTAYRGRNYAPQSIVISAAGKLDHASLVTACEALAPRLPASEPAPRTPPVFQAARFLEARKTHDTHLALAWPAPAFAAPGSMAHALAVQCLGGGMTSRLFQAIREEAGLAYGVDAYQMVYADCALGVIQTATAARSVAPMMARLRVEMARMADDLNADELTNAKRQFRASLAMAGESMSGLAARNARQMAMLGCLRSRAQLEEEIEAVSLGEVRGLWADVLHGQPFARSAVGSQRALDLWAG
jgi:predicted Zn-dependent peptidase